MAKKNNWDFNQMQESLVKDTEKRIEQGFHEIANEQGGEKHHPSSIIHQPSEQEPTKGVQTYIPMSMYRRLNDIKLTRGENIAALVSQAIAYWLDAQEGMK